MENVSKKIPDFNQLTKRMKKLLKNMETVERDEIGTKLKGLKGVYVFFENNKPIYVGKTDNLSRRLKEHARVTSKHNDANFAFNLAKIEFEAKQKIERKLTRKILQDLPEFNTHFTKAKKRVSNMKMKYVTIEDPHTQYLFEFFAALHFKTKYNEFRNH